MGEQAPPTHAGALEFLFDWLQAHVSDVKLVAVGHRVVHGGTKYAAPMRLDAAALDTLAELVPLAPLHQPHNLLPIGVIAERRPAAAGPLRHRVPSERVAAAQAFALPPSITDRGVRRYGFHGLSYEYIASVLPRYDARAAARPWCCTSATRQHVRHERREERGDHDGLHGGRRPADGHAVRHSIPAWSST